jgi:hypothetical protein
MKAKTLKFVSSVGAFIIALAFLAKFGGPTVLRAYIYTGVGSCKSIPIICQAPQVKINNPGVDKEYAAQLVPYAFEGLSIRAPRGLDVRKGEVKKGYYKKLRYRKEGSMYLLRQKPDFFVQLFPRFSKGVIQNDYDFVRRTMSARVDSIKDVTDTFFVIMKTIFTPYLGDQANLVMLEFANGSRRGFINYNLGRKENYFDCNIIDDQEGFFKVYIRDEGARLNLKKVFTIISTLNKP